MIRNKQEKPLRHDPYAIRFKARLNQSDFWAALGVNQSSGSRYEGGRAMPRSVVMLLELQYVHGIDILSVLKNKQKKCRK